MVGPNNTAETGEQFHTCLQGDYEFDNDIANYGDTIEQFDDDDTSRYNYIFLHCPGGICLYGF